jgi:hypothetical protein
MRVGLLDCIDCDLGTRREYYMVRDEVWAAAGAPEGCLCIACLEQRIGRQLDHADFTDAPVNRNVRPNTSRRLISRLR